MTQSSSTPFWRALVAQAGRRAIIPVLITAAFLAAIVLNPAFDVRRLGQALASADYVWIIPAVLVFFAGVWVRAIRWRWLLRPMADVPVPVAFGVLIIGFMANNLLPIRAGELVRVHELSLRAGVSRTSSLATILVERIFDGLALLGIVAVVALLDPLAGWIVIVLQGGAIVFVGLLAAMLVLALGGSRVESLIVAMVRRLPAPIARRLSALVSLFIQGLVGLRSPGTLFAVYALSISAWLIESQAYQLVLRAFRIEGPAYLAPLVTAIANLAITVPSSQGGIGPFEFFAAETLKGFGIPDERAAAFALVSHATVLLPVIPWGIFLVWRSRLRGNAEG